MTNADRFPHKIVKRTFTCARCGNAFQHDWFNESALKGLLEILPPGTGVLEPSLCERCKLLLVDGGRT